MSPIEALILGALQGLTEFLPVSSSGHLVLVQSLMGLKESQVLFDVFLHLGSLGAVIYFFRRQIMRLTWKEWVYLGIGTVPAVLAGLLLDKKLESLFSAPRLIGVTLLITAAINFWSDSQMDKPEKTQAAEKKQLGFLGLDFGQIKKIGLVGLIQAIALTPGISRSGTTLAASLKAGFNREKAFELTFLLAIPAICGAAAWQVIKLVKQGTGFEQILSLPFLLGGIAAFAVSILSLVLLKLVIKQARFEIFGWYCAIVGIAALVYFR